MISFSQTGGTSGITQITISATSTQELADVVNHYTLGNESTSLDMPVVQKAYVPVQKYITISPSAITWSSSNNTGSITINSNDSWVVVSDGWIQVSRMYESDISERYNSVSGNGNTIIGISCFENIGDARIGGITAYCQSNSAISATTTVSQAGGYVKPYITLGTYSMQVSGGSVTTAVTVQSNVSWTATTDSNWVTLNTLTGSGNGNVSFTVSANTSSIERRATITVFNGEINAVLVLTQAASLSRPYIILSPNSFSVPYEGSTGNTISVSANCDYDIEADANWITVNAVSGSGNGSVSFSTSAMTGSSVGNIVFSNSAITEYATVETAFIPYLSANTNNILSSSTGGTFEVSVYSNVNWSVIVDTGEDDADVSWLSATPVSGSNDGTIRISVASGITVRTGSIVLVNLKYDLTWTISLTQAAPVDKRKIFYTSTDKSIITPYNTTGWGATILSNTYDAVEDEGVIIFDNDISVIPEWAFWKKDKLKTIEIPDCVVTICERAFDECSGLTSINIPNSVVTIEEYAFILCNACTSLTIGNSVRTIGNGAFMYCHSLMGTLTIPNSVTGIGNNAFNECRNLTALTIGNSVVTIGYSAFDLCTGFTGTLTIPNTVTSIGASAFRYCSGFTGILTIPNSVETIGQGAFGRCVGFSGLIIGTSVTSIGGSAFIGCSGFTSNLVVPNSVETIGGSAFYDCRGFSGSITLGNSLTEIGVSAFRNCFGFTELTLGSSVTTIGDNAFGLNGLDTIYAYPTICPSIGLGAFTTVNYTGVLHYPNGSDYSTLISRLPNGWTAVDDIIGDYLTVSPTGFTVDVTGSTGNQISITSNVSYNISSNVNWITLSDSTGSGNKTITFDTSGTTETGETSGVITVSSSTKSKTVSITRQAYIPHPNNEIHYTTTGGTALAPYTTTGWGSTILSNTYNDGQGILEFRGNVTAFPYNAYSNKRELQTIEMPNSVTVINKQSFIYCSNLQEVTIGSGVTSILNYAFYSCSSLATIYAHPTTAPTLGTGVFGVASSGTLHYPSGSDYSSWISELPSGWTAVADL